jgi:hypothetical protein
LLGQHFIICSEVGTGKMRPKTFIWRSQHDKTLEYKQTKID